jgi:hypothetical protein
MKYTIATLSAAALLLTGFAACDDNDFVEPVSTLQIVESSCSFDDNGGTGYISLTSPTAITAKSSADWCTVSVADKQVNVSVTPGVSIESRNALVTVYNAKDSVNIPVYQSGFVFSFDADNAYNVETAGGTLDFTAKISQDYSTSAPEWIHAEKTASGIRLTFDANTSEKYRKGTFTLTTAGGSTKKIAFGQLGANGIAGSYTMTYYTGLASSTSTKQNTVSVSIEAGSTANSYTISGLLNEGTLALTYNASQKAFMLANGTYVGTYVSRYYLYATSMTGTTPVYTTGVNYSTFFKIELDDEANYTLTAYNPGSVADYSGFCILTLKANSFASSNYMAKYKSYFNPSLAHAVEEQQ